MQEAMKMRWGDSKNLQKRDRSSCVSSLEHVALDGLKTRSSGVKCCQTLRNEIETRGIFLEKTIAIPKSDHRSTADQRLSRSCGIAEKVSKMIPVACDYAYSLEKTT